MKQSICGVLEFCYILCYPDINHSKEKRTTKIVSWFLNVFSIQDLIEKIKDAKYEFHADPWDNISQPAKDLVKCLLNVNYKLRYSPFQAITHPWIINVNINLK